MPAIVMAADAKFLKPNMGRVWFLLPLTYDIRALAPGLVGNAPDGIDAIPPSRSQEKRSGSLKEQPSAGRFAPSAALSQKEELRETRHRPRAESSVAALERVSRDSAQHYQARMQD